MQITEQAKLHLLTLVNRISPKPIGFRFDGSVGTCRASVPILKPVSQPPPDYLPLSSGEIMFFIPKNYEEVFKTATLDYETGLFARGLNMTWPHREGGCPNCNQH